MLPPRRRVGGLLLLLVFFFFFFLFLLLLLLSCLAALLGRLGTLLAAISGLLGVLSAFLGASLGPLLGFFGPPLGRFGMDFLKNSLLKSNGESDPNFEKAFVETAIDRQGEFEQTLEKPMFYLGETILFAMSTKKQTRQRSARH